MTRESYEKITGILRGHPRRIRLVCLLNHTLTGFIFVLYPAFLLLLFLEGSTFFLRALLVPAVSFAAVTLFRRIFNAPRPYEKFGLPPAIEKDTAGKSFPSRHVFSVFIIAATIFYVHPSAGILLGLLGVVLAVLRVIGGVHHDETTVDQQAHYTEIHLPDGKPDVLQQIEHGVLQLAAQVNAIGYGSEHGADRPPLFSTRNKIII